MTPEISDKRRIFEILMVLITGLGKLLIVDYLGWKLFFILSVILFWSFYIVKASINNKRLLKCWGLTFSDSEKTFKITSVIGVPVVLSMFGYGLITNSINFSWHILFVLVAYPIWGIIQQFLIMSLFAGNLNDLKSIKTNNSLIIFSTSALFAIIHYPSLQLISATFLMALMYSIIFLKHRNIIPLGLFHGIVGGLFYYIILKRDPLVEIFKLG